MGVVDANLFPKVILDAQSSDPAAPSDRTWKLYSKAGGIYARSSNSIVGPFGTSAGLTDPMTTRGDVIVRNASNVTARLAIGSSGKVLSSDGTDISWQTPSAGGGDTEFAEATRTAGDLTTTSTSFVDATGITVTLTTAAVRCRVIVIAACVNSGANSTCLDIAVDGTLQGQANGLTFAVGTTPTSVCFEFITAVLSAASHTIKLQWRVTGGTGTLYASTSVAPLKIQVIETNLVA